MSFEGEYQILCKKGHYSSEDCYSYDQATWTCAICGSTQAWTNLINFTNGSYDENNNRIDGYVQLELETPATICTCSCGNKHKTAPDIFKIPK